MDTKKEAQGTAAQDEEGWTQDREVFARDEETKPGASGPSRRIYVTEAAKKRWSDKNPRKFTPDVALKVIGYIGAGCFIETAAAAAGLNKSTLYEWMKRAERNADDSTEELRAWKTLLDEAEANAEARAVRGIQDAGAAGAWQAYAWFLERKYHQRWGRKDTTLLGNPDGSPLTPSAADSTDRMNTEQRAREVLALLAKAQAKPGPGPDGNSAT